MPQSADRYFYFVFVLLLCSLNFNVIARVCCAALSSLLHVSLFTTGLMAILLLLSGFMVPRNRPPKFWLALVYSSPMAYATDAIAINALHGQRLWCAPVEFAPPTNSTAHLAAHPAGFSGAQTCPFTLGEQLLQHRQFHADWAWRWWNVLFLVCSALFFSVLYYVLMRWWARPHAHPAGLVSNDVSAKLSVTGRVCSLFFSLSQFAFYYVCV